MSKTILGKIYVGDNENVLFVINDGVSQICLMNGECDCKVLVDDQGSEKPLNFNEHHQITGIYRLRRGCEKTIYFTDNYNPPRYLNLSDVDSFKEITSTSPYIEHGALDTDKMLLQKTYDKIPEVLLEIKGNGQLLSGSYNVSVRYVDEDLNPSEWMQPTEPIMIWQSDATKFNEVRASSNEDVEYRKYGPTHKSIRASVRNTDCDHSYLFVQFALIAATTGTGIVNDVVYSPLIEMNFNKEGDVYEDVELSYNFTGGSDVMTGSEDEVLANTEIFDRVKCIEQADNRLVMGNVTDMDVDWCKLQKYASRIVSDCVVKEVNMTDYTDKDNHKNPMVLYNNGVGYQPGEIYSFGIVYVFENGVKSPVYHIPGRSSSENAGVLLCGGDLPMQQGNNLCTNMKYSEMSMSCEGFRYWGSDNRGAELGGTAIRHHRFPLRQDPEIIRTESESERCYIAHYNLIAGIVKGHNIRSRFKNNFDTIIVKYDVNLYDIDNNTVDREEFEIDMQYREQGFWQHIYDKVDVSLQNRGLIDFVDSENMRPSRNAVGVRFAVENSEKENIKPTVVYGQPQGDSRVFSEWTMRGNRYCSNPFQHDSKPVYLRRNKQHRYVDIFSYDCTGQKKAALLQFLQEYPQFRENNSDINSRPVFMTTGGVIVYRNYGTPGGITGEGRKERAHDDIASDMETLDDDFFLNAVKVLPKQKENAGGYEGELASNGRRVKLRYKTYERELFPASNGSEAPDNENDNSLYFWSGKEKKEVLINTSIGFYVEPRIECVQGYESRDTQQIFGIKFGNIDIPDSKYLNGHKVVGYYFVQNERTAEDMTVLDSAVLTPLFTEKQQTKFPKAIASGIVFADDRKVPKTSDAFVLGNQNDIWPYTAYELYTTNERASSLVRNHLFENGVGFINPRFKFNKEELYNFRFRLLGYYTQQPGMTRCSTDINELWVTQDVQSGSSYNKKINKKRNEDDDGYDLHVFHRNSVVKYGMYDDNNPLNFNSILYVDKKDVHYLAPSSYINKEFGDKIKEVYNVSGDNNMGFMFNIKDSNGNNVDVRKLFVNDLEADKISYLPYGYFERDLDDYYPDFGNRPYFVVSDFIPVEQDPTKDYSIFRGDCYCSAFKYTTSMQYDIRMKKRAKKETWWMYTVGALGIAGGIVASIYTGPAGATLIGPSVSLIQNGIRTDVAFNTMKRFADTQGKNSLTDGWGTVFMDNDSVLDDEIQWLCESIDGIFFESSLNLNWRVGTTISDITDYLNPLSGYNASELRQYFQKKLTYADKEHKDGRMYRGFALAEIYDINKDFQRRNKQKMYYCIPITHKCCSECENSFPKRIVYSQQSFAEERTDNYKVFLPGNYTDIGGETGDITYVSYQGQDAFMVFTEEGLWQFAASRQQHVNPVTQVVSFLGTGDFFNTPAQRVTKNDTNICFGSKHQTSFCNTPAGLFWYSEHDNAIYTFADKMPVDIFKQAGMGKFFEREGRLKTDSEWYKRYKTEYPFKDNPSSELGTGYVLGWDNKYGRLLITKKDKECSFASSCFYDEKRMEQIKQETIDRLNLMSHVQNICFHWSKEKCCWVFDYETNIQSSIDEVVTTEVFDVTNKTLTTVLYMPDFIYYYDKNKNNKCEIDDVIIGTIGDAIPGRLIVVCDDDTYIKIAKYYPDSYQYSLDDNIDVTDIVSFLTKDWVEEFAIDSDNLSYLIFTSNETAFNGLNQSCSDRETRMDITDTILDLESRFNFSISAYPIWPWSQNKVNYSTLSELMTAKGIDWQDYNDALIIDEYCCVLDKITLGEEKEYKNNVDEYREVVYSVYEEIMEKLRHIEEDEFEVSMFDDLVGLIVLINTYNYWNLLKNAYDFTNYDMFGNGNNNLLMFKNTSDAFNAFALGKLGTDWYDENAAYGTLEAGMSSCANTIMTCGERFENMPNNIEGSGLQKYISDLFDLLYNKYLLSLESMIYVDNNDVAATYNTLKTVVAALAPNGSSLPVIEGEGFFTQQILGDIQNFVRQPFGNPVKTCASVHGDVYLKNFADNKTINGFSVNRILSDITAGKDFSSVVTKTANTTLKTKTTATYTDHRLYVPNAVDAEEDVTKLNDNSFTISYKPGVGFISFHSYMPSLYVGTPDALFTWRVGDDYVYRHNIEGSYQHFYGDVYPFVVESVDKNPNIAFGPQVIDSISLLAQAEQYVNGGFREMRDVFFTNVYFYNSRQCSLFSEISVKKAISDENYFDEYLGSDMAMNIIPAERRESLWHINKIRDFRVDYDNPIHLTDLNSRENFMYNHSMNGWIDKVLNEDIVDINKNWWDLEPFRDNFICQRYFYVPSSDDGIRLKVLLSTTTKAQSIDNTLK